MENFITVLEALGNQVKINVRHIVSYKHKEIKSKLFCGGSTTGTEITTIKNVVETTEKFITVERKINVAQSTHHEA